MEESEQEQNVGNFCFKCQRSFAYRNGLTAHIKKFHPEDVKLKYKVLCPLCEDNKASVVELQKHFEEKHPDIPLKYEEKTFNSEEDFVEWKNRFEQESFSRFIKRRAPNTLADGRKVCHFYCHRSGDYKSCGKQNRHLKVKGSNKIGKSCPAHLTAFYETMEDSLEITVLIQYQHVGHEVEIGRIPLPKSEKNLIAGKLIMEIPKATILKDIQKKYSPTKRVSYTHRKDLHNICRDFNINSAVRLHEDDATSIHLHIQKLKAEEGTPVAFYKPLGEVQEDHPSIKENEFFLMLMSGAQQKILELYGSVIMIDGTHGMNSYGYHLTTVMVNDANHEGFPVAVLYSSRRNTETYSVFFKHIKDRCPLVQPVVFMSDDDPAYYNAWEMIFGPVRKNLLCSWHVLRAWHNQLSKIQSLEKRNQVKEELNTLLHETDVNSFERLCVHFMEKVMAEEELKSFGEYFNSYYLKRKPQWAYCYRVKLGVNTNMKLERWHREIKHEEGEGKSIVRMDKSLCLVLNAISKKVIGRLISMERGKLTTKISEIRSRHKKSKEMNKESVVETSPGAEWTVFSSTAASSTMMLDTYCVSYEKDCACNIRCEDCKVCIHALSCTCHDYSIRFVICKHIHLVCSNYQIGSMQEEGNRTEQDEEMPDSLAIDWSNEKALEKEEQDALDQEMKKSAGPSSSLEELKGIFNAEYSSLINSLKSEEEAKVFFENLKVLKSKLIAVKGVGITSFPEPKVKTSSRKNIEPQRKFKAVKATKRKHDD